MRLHYPITLSLLGLAACTASDSTRPDQGPSFLISDAVHSSGNPDFFWLPPDANDPSKSPYYDASQFNYNLEGVIYVTICALDVPSGLESDVNINTPCKAGGYFAISGTPDLPAVTLTRTNRLDYYGTAWTVPSSADVFYRIRLGVGSAQGIAHLLGIADVHSVPSPNQLKYVNQDNFIGRQDGSNLPIKARIENAALCDPPGVYPCRSAAVALAVGGDVNIETENGNGSSGIHIPGQNHSDKVAITVQTCADLNPRAIDLPVYGSCIRVLSEPALPNGQFDTPATVAICDVGFELPSGMPEAQEQRITMHRLDAGPTVTALPHEPGCPQITAQSSLKGFFRALAGGHWKAAGRQLAGLLGPTPLYARRRLDAGGQADTGELSDFQFALPAKMTIVEGNDQTAVAGSTLPVNPKVLLTDLGDLPVAGATIKFVPSSDGKANGAAEASVVTGADGTAAVSWTLAALAGTNTLVASGRGVAGENCDGPRPAFDPFQPIQFSFDGYDTNPPKQSVLLCTGTRTFTATGTEVIGN